MVEIRQLRQLKSNVEDDEILCKNREIKCRYSVCIAGLAINCQDIAGTAAIAISPFKTYVPKQPQPPLTLLLVAITREQDVSIRLLPPQGCGAVVKMIQLRLRSSSFMNMTPAPELMVFMCVAPEQWRFWNLKNVEATPGPRQK